MYILAVWTEPPNLSGSVRARNRYDICEVWQNQHVNNNIYSADPSSGRACKTNLIIPNTESATGPPGTSGVFLLPRCPPVRFFLISLLRAAEPKFQALARSSGISRMIVSQKWKTARSQPTFLNHELTKSLWWRLSFKVPRSANELTS